MMDDYLRVLLAVGVTLVVIILAGLCVSMFCSIYGEAVCFYHTYVVGDDEDEPEEEQP